MGEDDERQLEHREHGWDEGRAVGELEVLAEVGSGGCWRSGTIRPVWFR